MWRNFLWLVLGIGLGLELALSFGIEFSLCLTLRLIIWVIVSPTTDSKARTRYKVWSEFQIGLGL
jgi:hypothetical protein